jgi:hypothetical protein
MSSRFTDADYYRIISDLMVESDISREDMLTELNSVHSCDISLRTLDRIRARLGLTRNTRYRPPQAELTVAIQALQAASNQTTGIVITLNGVRVDHPTWYVTRDRVAATLQTIDPRAVAVRADTTLRERIYQCDGPNDCWHIDQNDKIKPFGFPLHAAVDGYSRFILWMKVVPSNNNPRVIAHHYLSHIERVGGCPVNTRSDYGSENNHMAGAQRFFRCLQLLPNQFDVAWNSHQWGPSTSNTRIESVWSRLKSEGLSYWRRPLLRLEHDGCLGNEAAVRVLQQMIVPLIQQWLDRHVAVWNRHRIRRSLAHVVSGAPNRLYTHPIAPAVQCLCPVSSEDVVTARRVFCPDPDTYTLWMSEEDRIIAEAAIEKRCITLGIQRHQINDDNWEQIFRAIVTDLTHDDIEQMATTNNNDAMDDVELSSSSSDENTSDDVGDDHTAKRDDATPIDVVEAQWRPLRIIRMNKSNAKVRKYLVAYGPNNDVVFTTLWQVEPWFHQYPDRVSLLTNYLAVKSRT